MSRAGIQIGAADHGRRMSLGDFRDADGQEGHRYELGRGIVVVTNVPNRIHNAVLNAVRKQLSAFEAAHPGVIQSMAGGADCKVIVEALESERHPDWSVYKTPMPADVADDEELWGTWVPDLVVEVVSPESRHRDYDEKPEEYLRFGIPEYWVIDPEREEMLVHRRRAGAYVRRVVRPGETYRPTILRGLELDLTPVFAAARAAAGSNQ